MPEACSLLRSARSIHGFDIIVMNGQKDDALKQLASNKRLSEQMDEVLGKRQSNLDISEHWLTL